MKRVSILGSKIEKVIKHTNLTREELRNLIKEIALFLLNNEIVIVPDKGIPLEIAKIYKKNKGKKVIGLVPLEDRRYGIEHIKDYLPFVDEKVNLRDWYNVNGEIAGYSDYCIVVGLSPGVIIELGFLKYQYKYLKKKTKVFVFKNTISRKLHKEIEEEVPITYISSVDELRKEIKKIRTTVQIF